MSLKRDILALTDLNHKTIQVQGMKFLIQEMTGIERDRISAEALTNGEFDNKKFISLIIANCVRDPKTKKRVFKPDDVLALGKVSWRISQPFADAVVSVNGLDEEEAKKN